MAEILRGRVWEAGYEVSFDPPADGNCFYRAAAYQVDMEWETLKIMIFDHLEQNQLDVIHLKNDSNNPYNILILQHLGSFISFFTFS